MPFTASHKRDGHKPGIRAVGLLSGGLDGILAARIILDQGIDVFGVTFSSYFFGAEAGVHAGRILGIPIQVFDIGERHLEMVKRPVYGYGRNMNPCIDCHALMLREAGRYMEEIGAHFLFTGEVLGQRPMSQRKDALKSVENLAGYPGRILRPLSAKLLPATIVEVEGLVDRSKLMDIQGRSRKRQQLLATSYGITDYPQPGGGCVLTKDGFSRKLAILLKYFPKASGREVELLRYGRQIPVSEGNLLFIGRNQSDNEKIELMVRPEDFVLRAVAYPGPVGLLLTSSPDARILEMAAALVAAYSDAPPSARVEIAWRQGNRSGLVSVTKQARENFEKIIG